MITIRKLAVFTLLVSLLQGCDTDPVIKDELPADDIRLVIPEGWPAPAYNFSGNELTKEGFILGRKLFYETKLSRDNSISCGSCHQQFAAFAHLDHPISHGIDGALGTRNSPPLYNLIWHTGFMWDGGVNHIEVQPLAPITNPVEMDEDVNNVINKLQADAEYRRLFKDAFGTETVTSQAMFKAMTQFMGMLVSYNSKYDLMMRGQTAFTSAEQSGMNIFQAKCSSCHTAPLFTNLQYMSNGLDSLSTDAGRAIITGLPEDSGTFKVPSLRNVELSRPYMHDGRFETLDAVLDHYSNGVKNAPNLSPGLAGGILLTNQEKADLIAFLKTLTDRKFIQDARFQDPFIN
jgi:cytochrome c peroxidase